MTTAPACWLTVPSAARSVSLSEALPSLRTSQLSIQVEVQELPARFADLLALGA
jgi:hypothetical protein